MKEDINIQKNNEIGEKTMKKTTRILCVALIAIMLLSLVSCASKFNSIKKNFEDAGYTYVESEDDSTARTIAAELEDGQLSCTVHIFKNNGGILESLLGSAVVLEFKSDRELAKAFSEEGSETLKGLIKDAQKSDYVNGNCVLITINPKALEIFKK